MIWPPLKAWTCKSKIEGQTHFVAINYGGKHKNKWVVLMSVLDSSLLLKVPWSELADHSCWKCGWDENDYSNASMLFSNKHKIRNTEFIRLSVDSGLTVPITKKNIRPWFADD